MRKPRRTAEVDKLRTELDVARPYLGLAREIHDEVQRLAADPTSEVELLADTLERMPRDARARVVESAFAELPAVDRWSILAELFKDDELRAALAREHEQARVDAQRARRRAELLADDVLDTRRLAVGEDIELGLFREADARTALARGAASTTCARRLVLRATANVGELAVIEDVFNPARGLFVTAEYDEATWQAERLSAHAVIRIGAIHDGAGTDEFVPVVYPGGRVDVESDGHARRGRLHAGFARVGDLELFTGTQP